MTRPEKYIRPNKMDLKCKLLKRNGRNFENWSIFEESVYEDDSNIELHESETDTNQIPIRYK